MYEAMASFYNRYTYDINYEKQAAFLDRCFRRYVKASPAEHPIVLDAACGTGTSALSLADLGYDMIGLDLSPEMLQVAAETAAAENKNITWICQDMCIMDLFGTVQAVFCMTDSLNHILRKRDLESFFRRVHLFTEPGGIFVFDALTEHYFRDIISGNVFCQEFDDSCCVWSGTYAPKTGRCTYDITCFEEEGRTGLFRRYSDTVVERVWPEAVLLQSLADSGLELLSVFRNTGFASCTAQDERRYYVCRRTFNKK